MIINLFIQVQKTCLASLGPINPPDIALCLSGDARGFEYLAPTNENRVTLSFNFDQGIGTFIANPSCSPNHSSCSDAYAWNSPGSPNSFGLSTTNASGGVSLNLNLSATQSYAKLFGGAIPPSIDEFQHIFVTPNRVSGVFFGDWYPSVEVEHIRDSGVVYRDFAQQEGGFGPARLFGSFVDNQAYTGG